MRRIALALAGSAALATAAPAATSFLDTFDGGGGSGTNSIPYYDSFANFEIPSGFVILWRGTEASTECVGGTGACIGFSSRNGTRITSRDPFAVRDGQRVTLEWDAIRHNAEGGFGFSFASAIGLRDMLAGGAFGNERGGDVPVALGYGAGLGLGKDLAYKSYSLAFTAIGDTALKLDFFGTTGLTLDNVRLTVTDVPEPASWAMMAGGFGLIGGAMRRKRRLMPA